MTESFPVLERDTVRLLDRMTIESLGIPGLILMENAGQGCASILLERLASGRWREPVTVLAGPGNNGGDGFVVARHLFNRGVECEVFLFADPDSYREGSDARVNFEALKATGVPVRTAGEDMSLPAEVPERTGVFVDALFGTGLSRPLAPSFAALFARVEETGEPVLAVDVPSGVDARTGEVLGAALRAAVTATFAAAKPGLVKGRGRLLAGEVVVVPISIPKPLMEKARADEAAFRRWAEERLKSG